MKLDRYTPENLRRPSHGLINIHPIQRGGILTREAREVLLEWADGYSVCDVCVKGRVDLLKTPPIENLKHDVAEFLNMDEVRFSAGARHAMFAIMRAFSENGGTIVLDSLAHYTSYIAAELSGLNIVEVPSTGYPEYDILPESYAQTFERVREETGSNPVLALLTHVDYRYGNVADAVAVGKICEEYGIPFILNAAYSAGVMPVDGKRCKAAFVVGSGHKSWAATAPIGVLAMAEEFMGSVLSTSKIKDMTEKVSPQKELGLFGCSPVYGLPVITLMASFPAVVERVKHWDDEVRKSRYFVKEMEKIMGLRQIGRRPTEHTLNAIETPPFYEVSKTHKKKGYFLYKALKNKGVAGLQPGLTKSIKVNTYGLTDEETEKVVQAFKEIARENGLEVDD